MAVDQDGNYQTDDDFQWEGPEGQYQTTPGVANDEAPPQAGAAPQTDSAPRSLKDELGDMWTPGADEEWAKRDYDKGYGERIVNKENLRRDNEVGSDYNEDGKGGYLTGPKKPASSILGGMKGGGGSNDFSGKTPWGSDLMATLQGLFPGGAFNQDIVNRRTDNARGTLDAQRKSSMRNNEAYLADRGLIGSGPQAEAANSLDSRLFGQFGQAYNDIYANESANADKRMLAALQEAGGVNANEAQNAVDQFRAGTERNLGEGNLNLGYLRAGNDYSLGQGNLALGNYKATNDLNLGMGGLNLDRDKLAEMIRSGDRDAALAYLQLMLRGADSAAAGFVPR